MLGKNPNIYRCSNIVNRLGGDEPRKLTETEGIAWTLKVALTGPRPDMRASPCHNLE